MEARPDPSHAKLLRLLPVEENEDDAYFLLRELQRGGYAVTHTRADTAPAMRAASWQSGRAPFRAESSASVLF